MLFKVDFQKAYDSVSWEYLDRVLHAMGFGENWLNWIQGYLCPTRCSVLLNGSPTNEFQTFRGLRQGDHISHFYLF